jgi:hypothetical protein
MNASRSRRIARLENKTARNVLNDPPEIKIVFVSPGGARSVPMRFDENNRLVPAEKAKRK